MSNDRKELPMPQIGLALRENNDVVIEARHENEIVGEFNISKVMTNWLRRIMAPEKPQLKSV